MPRPERRLSLLRRAALAALSAISALSMAACSLAGYAPQSDTGGEEVPIAVFTNYAHTVVQGGKKMLELKAARAELFQTGKKTVLTDVTFAEYDPETGELLSLGRADQAIYHTDTKDAEFSGGVRLESKSQDAILAGEYLRWIDKDKRLEGRLDRTVTISRTDGSSVSGAGFEASARKRSFSFRESVGGRIVDKAGAESGKGDGAAQ